jgi:hypothetical protein
MGSHKPSLENFKNKNKNETKERRLQPECKTAYNSTKAQLETRAQRKRHHET